MSSSCCLVEAVATSYSSTATSGGRVDGSLQGVRVDNHRTKPFIILGATVGHVEEEDDHWNEQTHSRFESRPKQCSVGRWHNDVCTKHELHSTNHDNNFLHQKTGSISSLQYNYYTIETCIG